MPRVEVFYRAGLPEDVLDSIQNVLPSIVANAMSAPDAPLTRENIEMQFRQASARDKTLVDIAITVTAGFNEERARNRENRREEIERLLCPFIPKALSFNTWIFMGVSAYNEVPALFT